MNERQDAQAWAEAEFGAVPRLDARRRRRLVEAAAALAHRPGGSLPQHFDWAELKGLYRLIDHVAATPELLQQAHRARTRARMTRPEPVLIIHDTTQLDFTDHAAVRDQLGPVGDDGGCGFLQHNSLAIDPAGGAVLGLIYQQTFVREKAPADETRAQRQERAARESARWAAGLRGIGPAPAGACWVDIGDREGDFFEWMAVARLLGHHFLIRLCQNRRVGRPDADGAAGHLLTVARSLPAAAEDVVTIASRGGRPARQARVQLASTHLRLPPPVKDKKWKGHPPLGLTVLRVWEPEPPPGEEALEWVLGTDLRVRSPADLVTYRDWYARRWPTAEEYHKVEKTGLGIEQVRFATPGRLAAVLALLSVIAVRVLDLRWRRDAAPEAEAGTVATAQEIALVRQATGYRGSRLTVRAFVDGVAKLGGYLGRKGDGPPGWQALWRGYQRLADMLLGIELLADADDAPEQDLPNLTRSG
jgi:Transposase DNA-binding